MIRASLAVSAAFVLAACDGAVITPLRPTRARDRVTAVPLDVRRLTQDELRNTVRDVFGVALPEDGVPLPPDGSVDGFVDNRVAPVNPLALDRYAAMATYVADHADLERLSWCDPAAANTACATRLIDEVGARAFRRPVPSEERTALLELFERERTAAGAEPGLRLLVEAMIQSPWFLYHVDRPGDGPRVDSHSLAARLAYFLHDAPPDDELRAAADRGLLDDRQGRAERARSMLADPRASAGVTRFFRQWLELRSARELAKDPVRYPTFDAAVADAMLAETDRFVDFVVREGDGSLETLFTGSFSFVPSNLRAVYGLRASATDSELVALDPTRRAGVLTQASVLASHARFADSSPVLRGVFLYRRVLCGELGDPPENVVTSLPPVDPLAPESTAEILARHRESAVCASCHDAIDPLGLAFEHYGALGEWRDDDDGQPIPPPLPLTGTDVDGEVASAVDLAERLATSRQVQDCVVDQWTRYAGLNLTSEERTELRESFQRSEHDVRELIVSIASSDAFARRATRSP